MMKSIDAMAPVGHLKLKKQAKLKRVDAANIGQRYMELLQLRGQVHELEASIGLLSTRVLRDQAVVDRR